MNGLQNCSITFHRRRKKSRPWSQGIQRVVISRGINNNDWYNKEISNMRDIANAVKILLN